MNNIYKSKWSEATQTWVACSELVRGKTKNNCIKIAAAVALALTSLGSYAAGPAPCDINAGNSVVASGTSCSLPDGKYTEISGSAGAKLEGGDIQANGTSKTKKVISLDGESELKTTKITTTNKSSSADASALAIAGNSKVTIDEDLEANSSGNSANVIANSDGSELNVTEGNIIIKDTSKNGFTNGIKNDNSTIDVKNGDITITSEIANSNSNSSIDNINGGSIKAHNITINQGDKNYAIHQTSENSSITVKNDLNITSGNIPEGNSAITIEGGDITVGGKTDITTHVDSEYIDDPENVSAISITNGKYTANGGADIKIKDDDENDFTAAAGVILGNEGTFENNGTLTVNGKKDENTEGKILEGKNTVIATDTKSGEKATFINNADGTTTSNVDTIVHNSAGTLIVKNHGDLNSNGGSVLKNDNTGTIEAVNDGILTGKIDNNSTGTIKLDNNVNPNRDPKKKDNRGIVNSEITNRNTGTINITNNSTLNGSITNTGDKIRVNDTNAEIPANILIDNNKDLNSTINNNGSGKIVVNNNEASSVINGNIINTKDGNITVNNKNSASTITGNITNQDNGTVTINNSGNIQKKIETSDNTQSKTETSDNTQSTTEPNKIENSGTGLIDITNTDTGIIDSDILNKDNGKVIIRNSGDIKKKKIENSDNTQSKTEISDNTPPKKIENSGTTGLIDITNTGTIDNDILNTNTGAIKITNDGTISGSITNTGNASTVAANNIDITNNNVLNSDINNDGNGSIVVNNNTASSVINGNITNAKDGNIAINNSGKANSSKITNSKDGKIDIINTESGKFESAIIDNDATSTGMITLKNQGTVNSSTIINQNTGAINITNNGTLGGSIKNTGNASTVAANNIDITNNNELTSSIENNGTGSIHINNAKNTDNTLGNITGNITNNNAGIITLDNNGKIASDILNGNTGTIHIINNNTFSGTITNTGDEINDTTANILIDNNKNLNSTINNNSNGHITVNNNNNSVIKGDINNTKDGNIVIKNSGMTDSSKKITNYKDGDISIANYDGGDFQSDIINDATSSGNISLRNSGNIQNNIKHSGTGWIDIINDTYGNIDSSIRNENTGSIFIHNKTTISGSITNTGDKGNNDNIVIKNNSILNSTITNKGSGNIVVNNYNTGKINSDILNESAGTINISNEGTLDGFITNTGDKINDTTANILIDNNKNLNSIVKNNGSGTIVVNNNDGSIINGDIINNGTGNISITNQDKAELNSNIENNSSGSITFTNNADVVNNPSVRINDTSLRQIQNTGNGKITIINNKTLNRPISNTSGGIIDITNNSSMETDITNNTESSEGGITFKNKQEFKGKLINANSGSVYATNTGTFTGMTTNSGSGILDLDNKGIWNNTGNSVLTKLQNTTGTIIFPQVSEVNAGDKDQYHTITVNGNYTGGGLMRVNTVWNKDGTSYSDRVDIHGDVDGAATTVQTLNKKGIYGDVTLKEIPIHSAVVVHVAGKSSGNDFTGSAPTTNAGEAQLKKIDTTSGTDYAWTLTAQPKTPDPVVPVPPGPTVSDKPVPPAPPIKEVPIYAEPVSGYVQMPAADMELGFTTVGTLHERRGENQTYNITGSNNTALGDDQQQTWGRVLVKHLDKDGKKRLDTAGNQSVLQIGHDFILDENEKTGTRRHIGGYVAYGHNENDFRDEYRAKNGYIVDDHYTGKGRTDAVSVGGYGTFYGNNGGYVDLVGQVTYLRNKYNARSNESVHQNGWGAALSAETGKSFIVYGNNWFVEPQAQLVYQYLSLDDFNDRIRHVDQHDPSALRGRVGMRFGYNGDTRDNLPSSSFYGIANIWHDFVNPKSVDIGRDSLKEEYAKTWGELGLGIQLPITRQSDFYSDIRYEKNFGSDKRKGFKGTMGYKYTWL